MSLDGKTALVTGGASGIGRSVGLRLARDGAAVAIFDLKQHASSAVAEEIETIGRKAGSWLVNVVDRQQVNAAVEEARTKLGPIGIIINGAGFSELVSLLAMDEEQWDSMIAVHLKGTFNCTQAVLPDMIKGHWGRIVMVSSVVGLAGAPGLVHYAAAMAGVIGFTKALARELGPKGITVNAVAPGVIDTPILHQGRLKEHEMQNLMKATLRATPMGRTGVPEDVAAAGAYLVSDEASFLTGQVLSPNGGIYT